MKSLEIVNYKISLFEKDKQGFTALSWFQLNDIKQDLEVLEIIRNKRVDIIALESRINAFKDDNERILYSYNAMFYNKKIYKLTLEELLKLKQWLEVNENDR